VVKHIGAVEVRIVFAAVLAVAADAVLVAQHLLKLGAHLVTALAHLNLHNFARKSSPEAESIREKKGGEERRTASNSVWQFGTRNKVMQVARARVRFYDSNLSGFGNREKNAGCGRVRSRNIATASCSLQSAKASAASLSQHEKNDTEDVQRGCVTISGFIGSVKR
jgi:hypothetical protein